LLRVSERIDVCRKCKRNECLLEILESRSDFSVRRVRCQKICHGPVVGFEIAGTMEWFERVGDVKSIASLVKFARRKSEHSKIPKPLRKHRLRRRSGRPTRT
jgi:hypothetical protein